MTLEESGDLATRGDDDALRAGIAAAVIDRVRPGSLTSAVYRSSRMALEERGELVDGKSAEALPSGSSAVARAWTALKLQTF